MEKKLLERVYRCAYCEKEYASPTDRAKCELECFRKREGHRAEAERMRLEQEKRFKKLRFEAEHAALEQELGELVDKMIAHAAESGMNVFRCVRSYGGEKFILDIAL